MIRNLRHTFSRKAAVTFNSTLEEINKGYASGQGNSPLGIFQAVVALIARISTLSTSLALPNVFSLTLTFLLLERGTKVARKAKGCSAIGNFLGGICPTHL